MVSHDMQAVLFDLDGTLLDTHDLLLATFRYTARTVLREAIPDERLMAKVGQPLNTQMWDFTDDPAVHEELCRVYREYNAEVHDDMIRLFDGTVPMLERLKEAGLPLAVVTSKRHEVAMRGLDLFGLTGYFDFSSAPTTGRSTSRIRSRGAGCERLGLAPQTCLYVGDSPFDMQSGSGAGCATAAALWGMFPQSRA